MVFKHASHSSDITNLTHYRFVADSSQNISSEWIILGSLTNSPGGKLAKKKSSGLHTIYVGRMRGMLVYNNPLQ